MEHFIDIADFSKQEILDLLDLAAELKHKTQSGEKTPVLSGQTLAMLFEKPSNRTMVSFNVGIFQLGGMAINLNPSSIGIGGRESIADVSRTLSRYVDGAVLRTFRHETVTEFARNASVPVINGLTDYNHPCQAMADLLTIREKLGTSQDYCIAYVGDGNNVLRSLIQICRKLGIAIQAASPEGYEIQGFDDIDNVFLTNDPFLAVKNAQVIYTDVWASMGQESETELRKLHFKDFQLNKDLVRHADPRCLIMHCLPAHRGEEVTDDVIESPQSVVFDQAENRLHAQKAIMAHLMKKG